MTPTNSSRNREMSHFDRLQALRSFEYKNSGKNKKKPAQTTPTTEKLYEMEAIRIQTPPYNPDTEKEKEKDDSLAVISKLVLMNSTGRN